MDSVDQLEAKKKELQLKRDIARMELEQSTVVFVKKWKWPLWGLALFIGFVIFVNLASPH